MIVALFAIRADVGRVGLAGGLVNPAGQAAGRRKDEHVPAPAASALHSGLPHRGHRIGFVTRGTHVSLQCLHVTVGRADRIIMMPFNREYAYPLPGCQVENAGPVVRRVSAGWRAAGPRRASG